MLEKVVESMRRKIVFILILTAMTVHLAGCTNIGTGLTPDESEAKESNSIEVPPAANTDEPQNSDTSVIASAEPPAASETTEAAISETQISDAAVESSPQTDPIPAAEETQAEIDEPKWSETPVSGELYVNTDNIFSRIKAIQGSERVKQYRLNDMVTVVAKTDTDYYKLNDGTFIHADYLSESKTEVNTGNGELPDYTSVTAKGYTIERKNGITYVDGIMIANKTYTLPSSYDPGITSEAAGALAEMQSAAAADGISLFVVSGYRSYYSQESVYAGWVNQDGVEVADTYSSRPGHSDHQTGYAFDLNSLSQSFAYTKEGIWLAEHCADFGFIIRYPEGKEMYTGYIYEPWHVRYIGKEKAKVITESGLSLEEYYGFSSDYSESESGMH